MDASERKGIVAALVSSALGGSAGALTRYVIGAIDPVTLAAFRFGIAFLLVLPIALAVRSRWPQGKDWYGVAALGILFFCIFFVLYNIALAYTSAARGSLALSTLPVATMLVGSLLGVEGMTRRKTTGVLIATGGAASFYLWVYALEHTTPTRVTNTMTVNPISASLLAAVLLSEPLGFNLALGVVAVGSGIWIASTSTR